MTFCHQRHRPLSVAGDLYHFFELMILGDARHFPTFFEPLPPTPVHDSLSLKTPPECLLVPLPPSPVDDSVTPETPPIECCRGPLPSSRVDDFSRCKTPPDSFFVPLPPSPVDDSLSLKTSPGCLLVPLPPSPVEDFLTPQKLHAECRRGPPLISWSR